MPHHADQLHDMQPHPARLYSENQPNGFHHAARSTPLPYVEVVVPQNIYHQQPVHQVNHLKPYSHPQTSRYPVPLSQEQHRSHHGCEQGLPYNMQVPNRGISSIQVMVPSKTAYEPTSPPVDHQLLLLDLAHEYLEAAYGDDMLAALRKGEAQLDDYYKLVSSSLGCMETVLKKFRLPPLKEAQLRLRFARTLYDETDNDLEAETALSKGVDLCERNKLIDLKYTMQVLLSKVLYKSNPKAATKAVDVIVEDVAAYKHTAWEYAFRYLRATLSLSMSSQQEFVAAVHQLQKIADLARKKGDQAVFAFAGVTEALIHLQSSSPDSTDQAQRALATTRQVQLHQDVTSIPQIQVSVQFVDLCCSLRQLNLEQMGQKLSTMRQIMDQIMDDTYWLDNGTVFLPLTSKSVQGIALTGGDIVQERNGRHVLALSWLPKNDVYAVGYLLSALATSHRNAQGEHQGERFLDEGLALIRRTSEAMYHSAGPLSSWADRTNWRKVLECQFLLEKAFLLCARSEWEKARTLVDEVDSNKKRLPIRLPDDLNCLARYLTGAIYQGTGDLTQALNVFLGKDLALPPNCNKVSQNNIRRDVALLAAMNAILIIRSPAHQSHHLLPSILTTIDPYLAVSPNKHLLASRSLLISNLPTSAHPLLTSESLSSTLLVKKHLSTALNIAKTIGNAQITAMSLAVMSGRFFRGVVGEQAEKSARAGQNMAYKSGMKMWMSVGNGMLAETLERQGKREEAERVHAHALRLAGQMPSAVQRFEGDGSVDDSAVLGQRKQVVTKNNQDHERDELA